MTHDTCSLPGLGSSPSASLQSSLESRLRARLGGTGSDLYSLRWKSWAIAGQEPICALRGSVRPTSGSACTGWPTPRTVTGGAESAARKQALGRKASGGGDLQAAALSVATGWATPKASDGDKADSLPATVRKRMTASKKGLDLAMQARVVILDGSASSGSSVRMLELGPSPKLNPRFSLWLMGFPDAWASCGGLATR